MTCEDGIVEWMGGHARDWTLGLHLGGVDDLPGFVVEHSDLSSLEAHYEKLIIRWHPAPTGRNWLITFDFKLIMLEWLLRLLKL